LAILLFAQLCEAGFLFSNDEPTKKKQQQNEQEQIEMQEIERPKEEEQSEKTEEEKALQIVAKKMTLLTNDLLTEEELKSIGFDGNTLAQKVDNKMVTNVQILDAELEKLKNEEKTLKDQLKKNQDLQKKISEKLSVETLNGKYGKWTPVVAYKLTENVVGFKPKIVVVAKEYHALMIVNNHLTLFAEEQALQVAVLQKMLGASIDDKLTSDDIRILRIKFTGERLPKLTNWHKNNVEENNVVSVYSIEGGKIPSAAIPKLKVPGYTLEVRHTDADIDNNWNESAFLVLLEEN